MPNNSNLFLDKFAGEDFHAFCDPSQIADMDVQDAKQTADFTVTQNGAHLAKVFNKVVDDTSYSVRATDLKQKNKALYDQLLIAGADLGQATLNRGNTTKTYKISVSIPLVEKGNPAAFSSVSFKMIRQ
jgi:hypothetical protein